MEFNEEHSAIVPFSINGGLLVFDIKFNYMDDIPFYKRPWFYIAGWLAILLLMYGAQIYRMGGVQASLVDIFVDLVCIFPFFLVVWMAFFAQFVLPVNTFRDRQKIFDRLVTHLFGGHGPALFIENGEIKEHSGERLKKGPGVVWLDSASAAVTRTAVAIKQTMGLGVYFIENGEFIAGTVDLHTQLQSLGPREEEKPFDAKNEKQTDEEWRQIQNRRKIVSALTRDGIEVVPNISIIFRVDTGFPSENEAGSRFGYRTGITKKAQANKKKDQESIRKAILGEGVNPNERPDSNRYRVKWNELPASLAVDVWREYVAKFTLDELFTPDQIIPPPPPKSPQPTEDEIDPLSQPLEVGERRSRVQHGLAAMLHEINLLMSRSIRLLEEQKEDKSKRTSTPEPFATQTDESQELQKHTALQVINEMVKARLTQRYVDVLGDTGKRDQSATPRESEEYQLLQERGLKVQTVSISKIRLEPTVEEQLIKQWSATWLNNAKAESNQLDRKRNVIETSAQEEAHIKYAEILSREINELAKKGRPEVKGALKALLLRSRALIRSGEHSDQLRRRMSTELQEIEKIIKWVEENGK